jgi:hypothetical protein
VSRVGAVFRPGSRGTKKWVDMYGDNLVCIRYRYDEECGRRFTTAEIIVHEFDWTPPHSTKQTPRVDIRVRWNEKELQAAMGAAGGSSRDYACRDPVTAGIGFPERRRSPCPGELGRSPTTRDEAAPGRSPPRPIPQMSRRDTIFIEQIPPSHTP